MFRATLILAFELCYLLKQFFLKYSLLLTLSFLLDSSRLCNLRLRFFPCSVYLDLALFNQKAIHQQSIIMPSFQVTTILDLIVSVIWASVNVPSYINSRFRIMPSSQAILSEILAAAGLVYCPKIFEIVQSETSFLPLLSSIGPCSLQSKGNDSVINHNTVVPSHHYPGFDDLRHLSFC